MRISIFYLLAAMLALTSCIGAADFEDVKMNIDTSLPVGEISYQTQELLDLLGNQDIAFDENGVAILEKTIDVEFLTQSDLDEAFSFNDQDVNMRIAIPARFIGMQFDISQQFEYVVKYNEGARIDNAVLNRGTASFDGSSSGKDLECTVAQITKDGKPLILRSGESVDLAGYKIELAEDQKLHMHLLGKIVVTGDLDSKFKLEGLLIDHANGFFGNKVVAERTTSLNIAGLSSDFLENIESFYITNPKLVINVNSDIDMPIMATMKSLVIDGKALQLKDGLNFNKHLITNSQKVITLTNDSFEGDKVLSDALSGQFSSIEIVSSVLINPTPEQLGEQIELSTANSFSRNSRVSGKATTIIPIEGHFKNIKFKESFEMDVKDDLDDIDFSSLSYMFIADNTLPLDIDLSLSIEDKNGNIVPLGDGVISIKAQTTDYQPSSPQVLDREEAEDLIASKKLYINLTASSTGVENGEMVKISQDQLLDLNLIFGINGDINLTE